MNHAPTPNRTHVGYSIDIARDKAQAAAELYFTETLQTDTDKQQRHQKLN